MNGCDDSAKGNCDDVLAEIYLLLDNECAPDRETRLRQHLDDCPPCLEAYGIDEQIKELLARKCGGDQAPDQLRQRLRASIRQTVGERGGVRVERTEVTVERSVE